MLEVADYNDYAQQRRVQGHCQTASRLRREFARRSRESSTTRGNGQAGCRSFLANREERRVRSHGDSSIDKGRRGVDSVLHAVGAVAISRAFSLVLDVSWNRLVVGSLRFLFVLFWVRRLFANQLGDLRALAFDPFEVHLQADRVADAGVETGQFLTPFP